MTHIITLLPVPERGNFWDIWSYCCVDLEHTEGKVNHLIQTPNNKRQFIISEISKGWTDRQFQTDPISFSFFIHISLDPSNRFPDQSLCPCQGTSLPILTPYTGAPNKKRHRENIQYLLCYRSWTHGEKQQALFY